MCADINSLSLDTTPPGLILQLFTGGRSKETDQDLLEAILRYFDGGCATNARDATNLYYEEIDRKKQVEYARQTASYAGEAASYAGKAALYAESTNSKMSDLLDQQAAANDDMNRQIGDIAQRVHDTNGRIDDMGG